MKKVLIGIVLIIICVTAGIFYFKNRIDTKDWEIYDKPDFKMSFKYPSDWIFKFTYSTKEDRRVLVSNIENDISDYSATKDEVAIGFETYLNEKNKTIDDLLSCRDLGALKVECRDKKINGIVFREQTMRDALKKGKETVFMAAIENGRVYKIEIFGNTKNKIAKEIVNSTLIK